jgi:hypothetical protein
LSGRARKRARESDTPFPLFLTLRCLDLREIASVIKNQKAPHRRQLGTILLIFERAMTKILITNKPLVEAERTLTGSIAPFCFPQNVGFSFSRIRFFFFVDRHATSTSSSVVVGGPASSPGSPLNRRSPPLPLAGSAASGQLHTGRRRRQW